MYINIHFFKWRDFPCQLSAVNNDLLTHSVEGLLLDAKYYLYCTAMCVDLINVKIFLDGYQIFKN